MGWDGVLRASMWGCLLGDREERKMRGKRRKKRKRRRGGYQLVVLAQHKYIWVTESSP
jgi:hypothetical protein